MRALSEKRRFFRVGLGIRHVDEPVTIGAQGSHSASEILLWLEGHGGTEGNPCGCCFWKWANMTLPVCLPAFFCHTVAGANPCLDWESVSWKQEFCLFLSSFFSPEFHGCCCYYRFCCSDLQNVTLMELKVLLVCWSTGGAAGPLKPRVCPADTTCFPQTDFPRPR